MSNFDKFLSLNCVSILAKYWLHYNILNDYILLLLQSVYRKYDIGLDRKKLLQDFMIFLLTLDYFCLQQFDSTKPQFPAGQPNCPGSHHGKSYRHVSPYISIHNHLSIIGKFRYYLVEYVEQPFSKTWNSLSPCTQATWTRV